MSKFMDHVEAQFGVRPLDRTILETRREVWNAALEAAAQAFDSPTIIVKDNRHDTPILAAADFVRLLKEPAP